ncbi:hypothetical protein EKPJFOCH_0496 [Methylobacterium thuringiense]|uniref:Uncharacterized protein n=1 Tax=Methylobacterium thuringiense TaxID=1003091 RepID=A0ABQ4TGU2_9HYPH|nr:hypothetical protein EKPJFOCH_0496 [Methylobacterium thuringiense]
MSVRLHASGAPVPIKARIHANAIDLTADADRPTGSTGPPVGPTAGPLTCAPSYLRPEAFTASLTMFFVDGAAAFVFTTAFLGFFVSRLPRCFSLAMVVSPECPVDVTIEARRTKRPPIAPGRSQGVSFDDGAQQITTQGSGKAVRPTPEARCDDDQIERRVATRLPGSCRRGHTRPSATGACGARPVMIEIAPLRPRKIVLPTTRLPGPERRCAQALPR